MTYEEIKTRLTQCETKLQGLKQTKPTSGNVAKYNLAVQKLEVLKESLSKKLSEAEKTAFVNGQATEYEDEKELNKLKDNPDVKSIKTASGKKIKEQQGVTFSVEETSAIAKKTGKAVAMGLKALGDEVAHMKAKKIEENSFEIYVEYKNDSDDQFSFYISDDTLHLVDFSFDKELVDVGVKPSGEAIVNVDVLSNELQKHWKSMKEGMSDQEFADAQENDRLNKHPEKDTILKIKALLAAQRKDESIFDTPRMGGFHSSKGVAGHMANTHKQDQEYAASNRKAYKKDDKQINEVPKGMFYIEVSIRDARKALAIIDDQPALKHAVQIDDSNRYYLTDEELAYDLMMDFNAHDVEVIDNNIELDEASDYARRRAAERDYQPSKRDVPPKKYKEPKNDYFARKKKESDYNEAQVTSVEDVIDPADYIEIAQNYLDGMGDTHTLSMDQLEELGRRIVKQLYKGDFKAAMARHGGTNVNETEEQYTVAGRPVKLHKGESTDGTDWSVEFENGKTAELSSVLALIKPFPLGITAEGEGDDHHYIKVTKSDYKETMRILDNNIDPTYVKTEVVDDDGAGNVVIYFIFRHEYGFDPMYDDPEGLENPELYQEPDEDPSGFMYDVVMDLQANDITVVDSSADMDENAKEGHGEDDLDVGHQDDEPDMLMKDVYDIATYAAKLHKMLKKYNDFDGEVDFPHWWQKKVTLARDYISAAQHYLEAEEKQPALDQLALEAKSHPVMVQQRIAHAKKAKEKAKEKETIKEDWGSSDHAHMMKQIHKAIGEPDRMPSPFDSNLESAVQDNVDFYWDDWAEYKQDPEQLYVKAKRDYLRYFFKDTFNKMVRMFEPADESVQEGFGKTKKAYDLVINKMKELAKIYKSGDTSVIAQLKDLTAKKKELEKMLEKQAGGIGAGQELDPNASETKINEEKATCCGKCGRVHVKGTKCKTPYLKGKDHCRYN